MSNNTTPRKSVIIPNSPTDVQGTLQGMQDLEDIASSVLNITLPPIIHKGQKTHYGDQWIKEPKKPKRPTAAEQKQRLISQAEKEHIAVSQLATNNIREKLIEAYWLKLMPSTTIMYQLKYATENDVLNDCRRLNIPTRAPDALKTVLEWNYQYDSESLFKGALLNTDSQIIYSEAINVYSFRMFFFKIHIETQGTPSFSYLKITLQFADNDEDSQYHDASDYPLNQLYESNETMPVETVRLGYVYCEYMRLKIQVWRGSVLDADNFFIIKSASVTC